MADNRELNTQDLILQALKSTQELRTSVTHVFEKLSGGVPKTSGTKESFVSEVQQNLVAIHKDLDDIEKLQNALPVTGHINLGNSSLISMDPIVDKTTLHSQVVNCYKWANKLQQHAHWASAGISSNSLKRSTGLASLGGIKRRKFQTQQLPPQYVDQLVLQLDKMYADMSVKVTRPFGSPAVLHVTLDKTVQAVVVLRGIVIEWVQVKGHQEDFQNEDGKLNIWSKSRYKVYQKLSEHTSAAILHFFYPLRQDIALKTFLTWFHSYKNLFSAPCVKCGNHLMDNLPPTWRDFRLMEPYHEACKP